MNKTQLNDIWSDLLLQMDEGSITEDQGHDIFSDLLTDAGMTWETFSEV